MKIISWNVNGLRSVYKKGFIDFLKKEKADIICLQEIKIDKRNLFPEIVNPLGYTSIYNHAEKKGYAGVAVFSKSKPENAVQELGLKKFDKEGRSIFVKVSNITLLNLYMPHGGRKKENLSYKLECYKTLFNFLNNKKMPDILIGDFNIAHDERDLARPESNQKNTMYTPEERRILDDLILLRYKDAFRLFNGGSGHYTWWPYRNNLREKNVGWRIDYSFIKTNFASKVKKSYILNDISGSDHCPIVIEI